MADQTSANTTTALIIGASGGIGAALVDMYLEQGWQVIAVSRKELSRTHVNLTHFTGGDSESSIEALLPMIEQCNANISRIIVTTGMLHDESIEARVPEKKLADFTTEGFMTTITVNSLLPALWIARLQTLLKKRKQSCVIAVLSARVGSISDNRLGGWYSYRGSKAALNMLLKTAAIDYAKRAPFIKLLAFHPGTTDTALSKPFQKNVPPDKLFSPHFVAQQLMQIMDTLKPDGKLSYLDWQGKTIEW